MHSYSSHSNNNKTLIDFPTKVYDTRAQDWCVLVRFPPGRFACTLVAATLFLLNSLLLIFEIGTTRIGTPCIPKEFLMARETATGKFLSTIWSRNSAMMVGGLAVPAFKNLNDVRACVPHPARNMFESTNSATCLFICGSCMQLVHSVHLLYTCCLSANMLHDKQAAATRSHTR